MARIKIKLGNKHKSLLVVLKLKSTNSFHRTTMEPFRSMCPSSRPWWLPLANEFAIITVSADSVYKLWCPSVCLWVCAIACIPWESSSLPGVGVNVAQQTCNTPNIKPLLSDSPNSFHVSSSPGPPAPSLPYPRSFPPFLQTPPSRCHI